MKLFSPLILSIFIFSNAYAEYTAGLTVDSSSNMLMQPEGESGTSIRFDGSIGHSIMEKIYISYNSELAFLENYNGLQYQNHQLSADYTIFSGESLSWNTAVSGNFTRFGDVTVLDGYNHYGVVSAIKYYIQPTVLLRWGINLENKDYLKYDAENYHGAETYLRLDKFFKTRTTLRLQFDSGARSYFKVENTPVSRIFDTKILIAQSFTDIIGSNIEFSRSTLSTGFSSSDSSRVYNSVFLDDKYKYSRKGISLSITRLISGKGSMKIVGTYNERTYHKGALTVFEYLPQNGWSEVEKSVSFILSYNTELIPDYIHPSCRLYYTDVNASESFLSYDSAGVMVNFSIF